MAHHLFVKDGELAEAGRFRIMLHAFYAKNEPMILRFLDRLVRVRFLNNRGRPILKVLSRLLGFLPTGEIVSTERALNFIDAISRLDKVEIAVGPCRCQESLGQKKGTYIKDMVILYGAEAYKRASNEYKDISSEEAKTLLKQLQEEGMIPAFYACMKSKGWVFVICNCESEICFPFRAHQVAGGILHPGPDIVSHSRDMCVGCGTCVERCHFGANTMVDGICQVDLSKCYGCGLCVATCQGQAKSMVAREGYRRRYYPVELVSKSAA
jgi:ferredoxin